VDGTVIKVEAKNEAVKERPSYQQGVPPFEYRMWGPRKTVEDYPYED
jgi:hypothetical protein